MSRAVHLTFVAAALLCIAALAYLGLRVRNATEINRALAAAATWTASTATAIPVDRRIALAHAAAGAKAGDTEAALRGFNALLVRGPADEVARAAMFDLGNLYLRQGIRATGNPTVFLPMLELAKQQYRELLLADPSDWDARFNLERALRYAPEDREAFEQPEDEPVERLPDKLPELLAPDLP